MITYFGPGPWSESILMDPGRFPRGRLPDIYLCPDYSAEVRVFRSLVPEGEVVATSRHGYQQDHFDPLTQRSYRVGLQRGVVTLNGAALLGHRDIVPSRFRVVSNIEFPGGSPDYLFRMPGGEYVLLDRPWDMGQGGAVFSGDATGDKLQQLEIHHKDEHEGANRWHVEDPVTPGARVIVSFAEGCAWWGERPLLPVALDGLELHRHDGIAQVSGYVTEALALSL